MRTYAASISAIVVLAALAGCASGKPAPTAPSAESSTAPAAECPESVRPAADRKGGACFEPDAVGEAAAKACSAWFESQHWNRDFQAEQMMSEKAAMHAVCYRP